MIMNSICFFTEDTGGESLFTDMLLISRAELFLDKIKKSEI